MEALARRPAIPVAASLLFTLAPLVAMVVLFSGSGLGALGGEEGASAEEFQRLVRENKSEAAGGAAMMAAVGFGIAGFVFALDRWTGGLPRYARWAGQTAATLWVFAGAFVYAAVELAGHYDDPDGARTITSAAYLVASGPMGGALLAVVALGAGVVVRRGGQLPAWYGHASLALGALAIVTSLLIAVGGVGMVATLPTVVWLVVTGVLAAVGSLRSGDAAPGCAPPP